MVKVLKKFPHYLEKNLAHCEKEYIKNFNRFESSIVQPHMWKFLKEEIKNLCVIREIPYEEGSRKALDLALITADSQIEYGLEIKGLPLIGEKANDLRNHIYEIGEDILTLWELLNQRKIQKLGFMYLAVSYEKEFKFKSTNEEIDINKILKVGLINALIARILKYCNKKFLENLLKEKITQLKNLTEKYTDKEQNEEIERIKKVIEILNRIINEEATTSNLGASAVNLWHNLDSNKSVSEILEEILEEIDEKQQSNYFSPKANSFLKDTVLCLKVIKNVVKKYKEDVKHLEYKILPQELDEILLSGNFKIRNFLFVIEPNQPS